MMIRSFLVPMKNQATTLAVASLLCFRIVSAQSARAVPVKIPGVISEATKVVLVRSGFRGLEGPVSARDGGLYFSAIEENRIYQLDSKGAISVWRENTRGTNGLYVLEDGHMLCAEGAGRRIVSIEFNGRTKVLASGYGGGGLRQPNDLIPDRKRGIYFTDPAPRPAPDVAPKEKGNVLYLRANGDVVLLDSQIARPNGLTLSLDARTLFVDDTEGEYIYAFDVQPDGTVKNKRPFVKLRNPVQGSRGLRSRADGMALDSEGRVYVATGSGVQVISPKGQHLGTIETPELVRNLAFAGADRHTLYLTAVESLYRVGVLSQGPSDRPK